MKDSGIAWIGEIPSDWDIQKLKYSFDIFSGSTPDSGNSDYWDGDIIWITPADYNTEDKVINDSDKKLTRTGYNACGTKITPAKSLIFSKRAPVGKVAVNSVPLCTNQGCFSCVPYEDIDVMYFYFMVSICTEAFELVSSGSTFKEISAEAFKSFKLPFPPFSEQHAIADYLDRRCGQIDEIVADLQRQIECLKKYKKSLISEVVTKGLNPHAPMKDSGIEWIGQIPEHWDCIKLRYLGSLQNGISKDAASFGSGYPFVSYSDVYNHDILPSAPNGLIESSQNDRSVFSIERGDVFFTRTSETAEEIGFSSTCMKGIIDAVFAGFLIRFRPSTTELLPEYSRFYFRAEMLRKYFVKEMMIVTRASLGQNLLKNLPVLLPPLQEQKQIADYLDRKCAEIDAILDDKRRQVEVMKEQRKSVIYEYVTGKKRVKEAV